MAVFALRRLGLALTLLGGCGRLNFDPTPDACVPLPEICDGIDDDCDLVADNDCTAAVASVGGGNDFACAVTTLGHAWCWGLNDRGQLGDGTNVSRSEPREVDAAIRWADVVPGGLHTCGLDTDGSAWCWGDNTVGELGLGTSDTDPHPLPVQVPGLVGLRAIAAGFMTTCAIAADGRVLCWGARKNGALGDGQTVGFNPNPTAVPGLASGLALTDGGPACALTGAALPAEARCWGADGLSEMPVTGLPLVGSISSGDGSACAVDANRDLFCFGRNTSGELGLGVIDSTPGTPPWTAQRTLLSRVVDFEASNEFACAVQDDQRVSCWGANRFQELGHATGGMPDPIPAIIEIPEPAQRVRTASYSSFVVTQRGALWAWGRNDLGQLGIGMVSGDQPPVPVPIPN